MRPCLLFQIHCQFKEDLCQHGVILIGHRIAGQKGMDAEMLCPLCLKGLKCLEHLIPGHSVLGIPGIVHNVIAYLKDPARIVAAADGFRYISQGLLQAFNMGDIVQVYDGSHLLSIGKLLRRRIIG